MSTILLLLFLLFGGSAVVQGRRPNILLLLTDDQDTLIGGTEHMPLLQKYLAGQGTTFTNAFVHTPICCPSRSSILSGRYLQNIPLKTNSGGGGGCNSAEWKKDAEKNTFAVYAQNAGYQTSFAGKYLNTYRSGVPPGWDRWMGLVGNSKYYNYNLIVSNKAGAKAVSQSHGSDFRKDYLPDVIATRTLESIRDFSKRQAPFLIMASWPTPHGPSTPAPKDVGHFDAYGAWRTPNYNTTDEQNAEKHWLLRQLPPIADKDASRIDYQFRKRQESLQTVDRQVELFVQELARLGELNNTIIIYTSDNGFQLGQHRLRGDKRHLYEHDIRVPMIVRGPGIAVNTTMEEAVLNIDLAPTIVELVTGSTVVPRRMDGRSFLALFRDRNATTWRSDFLVSYHGEGSGKCPIFGHPTCPLPGQQFFAIDAVNNTYHCVRSSSPTIAAATITVTNHSNSMYCRFDDNEHFGEFYDLTVDPWQLNNTFAELSAQEATAFEARLKYLKGCQGMGCRR